MDFTTTVITLFTGLIGVLCGTAVSSYFNMKSARKDVLFKRKLEYFEKLAQDIEKNIRLHKKVILSLSNLSKKKEIAAHIEELKQNRKIFLIMASPLYFNVEPLGEKITAFVGIEKEIFETFNELIKNYGAESSRARNLFELGEKLKKLSKAGEAIIAEMRNELYGQ
jgi:hypothetical protein